MKGYSLIARELKYKDYATHPHSSGVQDVGKETLARLEYTALYLFSAVRMAQGAIDSQR